jgi:16S rRNA (uracil1498-N3)-methyltransferase
VITLAVGPEGGFEPDELDLMRGAGFAPASLGASVLRFETAAVAGVAAARALLEAAGGVA